jgi:hypothetical protein
LKPHKRPDLSRISIAGMSKNARPYEWVIIKEFPYPYQHPWLATFGGGDDRCFVYVIAPDGKWPVKVGISTSPRKRLAQLQCSNWKRLKVEHCAWVASKKDALAIEKFIHDEFSENGKWLLGEWVDARPEEAKERIEWASMALSIPVDFTLPADKEADVQALLDKMWPTNARYEAHAEYSRIAY